MFETTGSLALVQPVFMLVGLVALPLLWTLLASVFARPTSVSPATDLREGVIAPIVAITGAAGTLGLAVVIAVKLALLPHGYVFVQHVAALARLGQLDLALDVAVDPRSATFSVVVALVACASTLQTSWSSRPGTGPRLAWTGLLTTGAMALVVGDGFAPILVGLGLLSIGAWGLARGGSFSANVSASAGNVAVLVGMIFLFWSLGGAFGPEGYDSDGAPRFVLVATGQPSDSPDKAMLTMTTEAGARVSADDTDFPGEPIAAPFAVLVQPGVYTFRVQRGAASADVVVPRVGLSAGRAYVLAPYGPTASLRVLDDQVAVPRLATNGALETVRATLAGRMIVGLRSSIVILLLVLVGGLAHVYALASRSGPSAIASVLEALPPVYLALRFAPGIGDPAGLEGAIVAAIGVVTAVVLAARAACIDDEHKALRGILAATAALALAAISLGDAAAGLVLSSTSLVAVAGALAALEAKRDARWLGVACAAAVGLFPGTGASAGFVLAITVALSSAATGSVAWAVVMALVASALVVAAAVASLAAYRVYDLVVINAAAPSRRARDGRRARGQGVVVVVLSIVALAGGAVLGVGSSLYGGSTAPFARRLVGAAPAPAAPQAMAIAGIVFSVIAASGGAVLGRRANMSADAPAWLLALGRPYDLLALLARGIGRVMGFLHRGVQSMDTRIIDDVPAAFGDLYRRVRGKSVAEGDDEAAEGGPIWTGLLLAMVATLAAVVLSALVLG
ncbi:MAG: hypothetical protein KIT84_42195 [Labilithrix sp.]|nr:hypothetical protein [Labilithrix sp.]MCW5817687.1 hypothetical protein [Labilithrix sp.]